MKALILRSIKTNIVTTRILALMSFFLTLVCISLIIFCIYQANHFHELLDSQSQVFQETLDRQLDDYLELAKIEQPVKNTNFPKRNLGKFNLSWYTPVELKKPIEKLRTATGSRPKENRTIAVDPKVIPYGSTVYIEGYGYFIAEDTGGAIKGNRIDIFVNDYNKARQLGRKTANVWLIGKR